ncbi:hypothetical protein [Anaerotignum sp.]|uniref:hypothetical protein n=1 Tax=Anaerotignum sp. TaxID=2039241 RepID=UPI0027147CEF|nr:hypothetical protein [Anaerotignum sp.]
MKAILSKNKKKFTIGFLIIIFIVFVVVRSKMIHTFSTERWVNDPQKRVDMVDNLLENHDLLGMTKEEVILLLGKDTETEYFKTDGNLVYYLGPERGLISIDSEWLVLEIAENQVTEVNIFRD